MNFWEAQVRRIQKKYRVVYKRGPSRVAMFFAGIALASWVTIVAMSGFPAFQYIYYTVRPATSNRLAEVLRTIQTDKHQVVQATGETFDLQPQKDLSLPEGHYVSIPSIGVDTQIWEAPVTEIEKALRRGVWRAPDMAVPNEGKPTVLGAHRFGYLEWTNEFRRKNSFFNLPKLKPGDEINIVWDQVRYTYKVHAVAEAEEIENYSYDLILYTCKFLVSPIRIFVYATRVN